MNLFQAFLRCLNLWVKVEIVAALILAMMIVAYTLFPNQNPTKSSSTEVTLSTLTQRLRQRKKA